MKLKPKYSGVARKFSTGGGGMFRGGGQDLQNSNFSVLKKAFHIEHHLRKCIFFDAKMELAGAPAPPPVATPLSK